MKTGRLDRRHSGNAWFKYYADFNYATCQDFVERRAWLWDTHGSSLELDLWSRLPDQRSAKWSWINDEYRLRLYFADDQIFNWFTLRWGVK
jgi:hypothetical protein